MAKNKKARTTILVSAIVVGTAILGFAFLVFAENIAANGRVVFYEEYKFSCTKTELMNAIIRFREANPKYLLPESEFLPNGTNVHLQYFEQIQYPPGYSGYLYNMEKNQIIHFQITNEIPILKEEKSPSILYFVGVNEGLTLGNWKDVNDDISGEENEEMKSEFEHTILDKLGIEYEKEGNSAPLFHNLFNHKSTPSQ